jgi:hypothetical protein
MEETRGPSPLWPSIPLWVDSGPWTELAEPPHNHDVLLPLLLPGDSWAHGLKLGDVWPPVQNATVSL